MSLEAALEANTKALVDHTAALKAYGGAAGGSASAGAKTEKKADKKPKNTVEQMKAAVMSVKDHAKLGADKAKALIEKHAGGEGKKLADLASLPDKFDTVVTEAEAMVAAADAEEEDTGDGGL